MIKFFNLINLVNQINISKKNTIKESRFFFKFIKKPNKKRLFSIFTIEKSLCTDLLKIYCIEQNK
jgi:hypothetical protein